MYLLFYYITIFILWQVRRVHGDSKLQIKQQTNHRRSCMSRKSKTRNVSFKYYFKCYKGIVHGPMESLRLSKFLSYYRKNNNIIVTPAELPLTELLLIKTLYRCVLTLLEAHKGSTSAVFVIRKLLDVFKIGGKYIAYNCKVVRKCIYLCALISDVYYIWLFSSTRHFSYVKTKLLYKTLLIF